MCEKKLQHKPENFLFSWFLIFFVPGFSCSTEMMGNVELAPEVDVSILEPLLSPNVVSALLDTYMSTLTVSRAGCCPKTVCA